MRQPQEVNTSKFMLGLLERQPVQIHQTSQKVSYSIPSVRKATHCPGRYELTLDEAAIASRGGKVKIAIMGDVGDFMHEANYGVMNHFRAHQEFADFDFGILGGDNIYPDGAKDAYDPRLTQLHNLLQGMSKSPDAGRQPFPWFSVLGNHGYKAAYSVDYTRALKTWTREFPYPVRINFDWDRAENQVQFSYSDINTRQPIPELIDMFNTRKIAVDKLPVFNMPSRFYSTYYKDEFEIFYIDSNTYVKDYLEYKGCKSHYPRRGTVNQAQWLEEKFRESTAKTKILVCHHPIYYTPGKRYNGGRSELKLQDIYNYGVDAREDKTLLKELGFFHECYSTTLGNIIDSENSNSQGLAFDLVVAGHEHNMHMYHNEKNGRRQLISGAGGAHPQKIENPHESENVVGASKDFDFGYATLTINGDQLSCQIFDATSDSSEPVVTHDFVSGERQRSHQLGL